MGVFVGVSVRVEVGMGGTVKETVGVTSKVQVGSNVLVGRGVTVNVGVKVAVKGTRVAVLEGMITNSGRVGVGKNCPQEASNKTPMITKTNRVDFMQCKYFPIL
jgi:hypothetical protein